MKILYSQLKELIPALKATPEQVRDALTLTGTLVDSFQEVEYQGKKNYLLGLEVRQNRPDVLGVIGVAREVAAYFGKKVVLPKLNVKPGPKKLQVKIEAKEDVKRVVVVRLEGLKNQASPDWLKSYLEFCGTNSINLIVDLSNYAMLVTSFPNHIFDADKVASGLVWQRSPKNQELITLDGSVLELKKNDHLVISDSVSPLVLASAVGGKRSAVTKDTKNVLIEVAVYNSAKLLRDARSLNVLTEAGNRLQKELATEPARGSLEFLVDLLIKHSGATVASEIFDYYPKLSKKKAIIFSAGLPSVYSGIPITPAGSVKILKNLGFSARLQAGRITATAPLHRTDIEEEVDCVEEIVRMVGYDKIPIHEAPLLAPIPEITQKNIMLAEKLRDRLEARGLDEILSLPLTTTKLNQLTNHNEGQEIRTQNSINEEFPALRQSLIAGLFSQEKTYLLKAVQHIGIFEIGKVFSKIGKQYREREMCAGLLQVKNVPLNSLKNILDSTLRSLGCQNPRFGKRSQDIPPLANPHSILDIVCGKTNIGLLYSVQPQKLTGNSKIVDTAVFEMDINELLKALGDNKPAVELSGKLTVFDANLALPKESDAAKKLEEIKEKIGSKLWSLEVVDEFAVGNTMRYTLRISYVNLTDVQAKKLHERVFNG